MDYQQREALKQKTTIAGISAVAGGVAWWIILANLRVVRICVALVGWRAAPCAARLNYKTPRTHSVCRRKSQASSCLGHEFLFLDGCLRSLLISPGDLPRTS